MEFKLTAKVPDMASFDNYTFTIRDTLSKGLTFNKASVVVKIGETKLLANNNYTPVSYTQLSYGCQRMHCLRTMQ